MKPSHILSIGVVIIAGGILYFVFLNNFSADQPISPTIDGEQSRTMEQTNINGEQSRTITIEDILVGQGAEAKTGNTVSVQYRGTLLNGTQFDSSYDRGEPFSFTIGQGQVIQGWEQGIPGMKKGSDRHGTQYVGVHDGVINRVDRLKHHQPYNDDQKRKHLKYYTARRVSMQNKTPS